MLTGGRVDELCRDTDMVAFAADAALDEVMCSEFGTHGLQIEVASTILEAGVARDHRTRAPRCEAGDQIFRQTIGEQRLIGVRREIVEGQHRDRRPIAERGHCGCAMRNG